MITLKLVQTCAKNCQDVCIETPVFSPKSHKSSANRARSSEREAASSTSLTRCAQSDLVFWQKLTAVSRSIHHLKMTYQNHSCHWPWHPKHSNLTICSALARHLRFCSSHCQFGVAMGAWRTVVYTKVGFSMLWPGCLNVASPVGLLKPLLVQGSCGGRTCGCTTRCGCIGGLGVGGSSKDLSFCSTSQPQLCRNRLLLTSLRKLTCGSVGHRFWPSKDPTIVEKGLDLIQLLLHLCGHAFYSRDPWRSYHLKPFVFCQICNKISTDVSQTKPWCIAGCLAPWDRALAVEGREPSLSSGFLGNGVGAEQWPEELGRPCSTW